jgi:hypothetical protein
MDRFEVTHKSFDLQSTPIFEPCPRCRTKQKWSTSPYCRECTREYNKKYYREHREEKLQWQRAHKEQIRDLKRKRKRDLVQLKGGKCERCGYDRNYGVLGFHHVNGRKGEPSEDWHSLLFNVDNVVLLCENCHLELHYPELQILKVQA